MNRTHALNQLFLDCIGTDDVERGKEMISDSDQSVARPTEEPIDGTIGDETRKLKTYNIKSVQKIERSVDESYLVFGISLRLVKSIGQRVDSVAHVLGNNRKGFHWLVDVVDTVSSWRVPILGRFHPFHLEQTYPGPKWSILHDYSNSYVETLTTPEDRTLLMYSKKDSSLISWSEKINVMPLPSLPAMRYKVFRSSSKLLVL